jgi:hypothetical protein
MLLANNLEANGLKKMDQFESDSNAKYKWVTKT